MASVPPAASPTNSRSGSEVTNARNPGLIDTAYVAGQPGPSFDQVLVPLPGREIQLGLRLRF